MMMCSCRSKSKVVFLEVSRYEGQLPRVDGVEVGLPGWLPATARRRLLSRSPAGRGVLAPAITKRTTARGEMSSSRAFLCIL